MSFRVGLTGGIGSGKSAVAGQFSELGVAVVDSDEISHALTGANGAAMPAIQATFGADVVAADGSLDRAAMRQRVFTDASARQQLESILHPLIRAESDRQLATANSIYAVLVVPLLIESGDYRDMVDRVLVVDCADVTRVSRVMSRSHLSCAEVEQIMAAQATRESRLAVADDVIENDGSLAELAAQVATLDLRYRRLATKNPPTA